MFPSELEYRFDEKGRMLIPPKFGRKLRDGVVSAAGMEKYVTVYPPTKRKKLAICNLLASLRSNRFGAESRDRGGRV